jgi:micrococcal nuclease
MRSLRYWRRHKFKLVILIVLILVVAATQSGWLGKSVQTAEQSQPGLYSINHFIDGDTIAVNMNGNIETVRMIGVDTPETHKPNTPVQCYGEAAAAYTKQLIGSKKVRLQADPLDTNRDRYGRLLRYIYLSDGTLVESQLINNGYGFAYTLFPFSKTEEFKADMQTAQNAHLGLWGACQTHQESSGAWQTNPAI